MAIKWQSERLSRPLLSSFYPLLPHPPHPSPPPHTFHDEYAEPRHQQLQQGRNLEGKADDQIQALHVTNLRPVRPEGAAPGSEVVAPASEVVEPGSEVTSSCTDQISSDDESSDMLEAAIAAVATACCDGGSKPRHGSAPARLRSRQQSTGSSGQHSTAHRSIQWPRTVRRGVSG